MKALSLAFTTAAALAIASMNAFAQHDMASMPAASKASTPAEAQGVGIVKAIDTAKGTITLQHEAIASIHWPAMTMAFKVAKPELLKAVKVGDKVRFTLHPAGMDSTITAIAPAKP